MLGLNPSALLAFFVTAAALYCIIILGCLSIIVTTKKCKNDTERFDFQKPTTFFFPDLEADNHRPVRSKNMKRSQKI